MVPRENLVTPAPNLALATDAQCPHGMKFINGEANMEDWKPSKNRSQLVLASMAAVARRLTSGKPTPMHRWQADSLIRN